MKKLTHLDDKGRVNMVDVSEKPEQHRLARAEGYIKLSQETVGSIRDNLVKKGDVLTIAEIAGIQGGKKTSELIPLCHPLPLSHVAVDLTLRRDGIAITATARIEAKTGVEMEAMTAAAVATSRHTIVSGIMPIRVPDGPRQKAPASCRPSKLEAGPATEASPISASCHPPASTAAFFTTIA